MSGFSFITDFPAWFVGLCILGGLVYAAVLYVANPGNRFGAFITRLLFFFRFMAATIVMLLLLSPYLLRQQAQLEQSVILLAHDNSASILLNQDSVFYATDYLVRLDSLKQDLDQRFSTASYLFGQQVREAFRPDFTDQRTDIAKVIRQMESTWQRKNVGAMVLFTDGIFNRGINPVFASRNLSFPIIAIALGDTVQWPDLSIHDLRHNSIVYRESQFPVEVTVAAQQAAGSQTTVKLIHNDEIVDSHAITITSDRFAETVLFNVEPSGSGQLRYTVQIDELPGEQSLLNNRREFYVDVIDQKQRILVLAAAPHPDIGAIQAVLQDHYEMDVFFSGQDWDHNGDYSLVITHQLPATHAGRLRIEALMESDHALPFLFILGGQTHLEHFNALQTGLQVQSNSRNLFTDAFPLADPNFGLFVLEEQFRERINRFPPLSTHLGAYQFNLSVTKLISQQIRGVATDEALIGIIPAHDGRKKAFVAGSGLWRWRIHDLRQSDNHEAFNALINKLINYLTLHLDTRPLRVEVGNEYYVNDEIRFNAELYNPSFELVNEPDLTLRIVREEDGTGFPFTFNRKADRYELNAGRLPEGAYSYTAETRLHDQLHRVSGSFRVLSGSVEALNTVANHDLLYSLSTQTGGFVLYPEELMKLPALLEADERIAGVIRYDERFEPLIGYGGLFLLITGLLFVEWLIRKINGAY